MLIWGVSKHSGRYYHFLLAQDFGLSGVRALPLGFAAERSVHYYCHTRHYLDISAQLKI